MKPEELIKKKAKDRGTTVRRLSEKTHIDYDALTRSLNGKRTLKAQEFIKVCMELDLDMKDFIQSTEAAS